MRDESLDKRKIDVDLIDWNWTEENVLYGPLQTTDTDCGVFSRETAEFICRKGKKTTVLNYTLNLLKFS